MASHIFCGFALYIFFWNEVTLVQSLYSCDTNKDCEDILFGVLPHCCGGEWTIAPVTRRSCQKGDCLNHYCEIESHCGDPKYCCRSNKCTVHGCTSCKYDSDCSSPGQVCCKKSFPSAQTFCAEKCHGLDCNNDDDCATGSRECCRDGKCVGGQSSLSCLVNCKANSDCHSGQHCCRKKNVWIVQDGCSETCIGEECDSDTDCGPPNECCIAGKCTKNGCPECSTDSDCPHCCRSGKCVENSVCAMKEPCSLLCIAVIVIAAVLFIALSGIFVCCYKRTRATNATQVNGRSLPIKGASNACFNKTISQQKGTAFTLQQEISKFSNSSERDGDGYVIPNLDIAAGETYDDVQRQPGATDYPPPYPSIH